MGKITEFLQDPGKALAGGRTDPRFEREAKFISAQNAESRNHEFNIVNAHLTNERGMQADRFGHTLNAMGHMDTAKSSGAFYDNGTVKDYLSSGAHEANTAQAAIKHAPAPEPRMSNMRTGASTPAPISAPASAPTEDSAAPSGPGVFVKPATLQAATTRATSMPSGSGMMSSPQFSSTPKPMFSPAGISQSAVSNNLMNTTAPITSKKTFGGLALSTPKKR